MTTSTDQAGYAPGATVTVTIVVRNVSDHPCVRPEPSMSLQTVTIHNAQGVKVWGSPVVFGVPAPHPPPAPLAPGEAFTYATVAWDQHTCDGSCGGPGGGHEGAQVPPGTYVAQGHVTTTEDGQRSATLTSNSPPFSIGAA